jgi:hypothetical protein
MPTLARATIQSAIAAHLSSISGVENVYETYPPVHDLESLEEKMQQSDEQFIQYWKITRMMSAVHTAESHPGTVDIRTHAHLYHTFAIEFFLGYVEDSSEAVFQDLVDTVLAASLEQRTFGGWNSAAPISLDQPITTDYLYQTVMCHKAVFTITIIDDISGLAPH